MVNSFDDAITRRIISAFPKEVPSPNLPPTMPSRLTKAGFVGVKVNAIPIINLHNSNAYFSHTALEWHGEIVRKHGVISDDELQAWLQDLDTKAQNDEFFMCFNRFLFSAMKV